MKDVEIIGLIKTYIKQTLVGMGALKGAACQITSIVDSGTSHVITFSWQDNAGVTHTSTLTLVDGADEVDELKDISITNLQDGQVLAWDNTAHKWVNTANSSTVASINNIGDVTVTNVTNGQILEWDDTASKWVNASLGTAAKKDSTNAVTENSTDVVESGAVYSAIDDAVKALDVSDTAVAGSYVTEVSETDGKISVTREAADAAPTENSNKLVKSGGVYSAIDDAVKALDVSDTAVAGSYVTEVSETDGKISVTREAADAAPTENSNKLVKSGGVYAANEALTNNLADEVETRAALGAHNLFDISLKEIQVANGSGTWVGNTYTLNGTTFTVANDMSVSFQDAPSTTTTFYLVNFTTSLVKSTWFLNLCKSKNVKLSSGNDNKHIYIDYYNGNTYVSTQSGKEVSVVVPENADRCQVFFRISTSESSGTIFPMIRLATDTDLTYQPYAKTNQELTAENQTLTNQVKDMNNVLGAKNLLPNNATSQTINGITFTVNDDDGSVTANGTATANAEFIFIKNTNDVAWFRNLIRDKAVTLSGCPSGGGGTIYTLRKWGEGSSGTYYDTGNGVTFTADAESLDNNSWNFQIRVYNGITVSNLTFYPMLRLASDTDDTYEPYAETNYQLTHSKISWEDNGILGAKNLLPFVYNQNVTNTQNCTASESNGVITYAPSGIYSRMAYAYNGVLEIGTSYRVRFKAKFTKAGDPLSYALRSNYDWEDSGNYVFQIISSSTSDYVTIDEVFTATSEDLYLMFYVARGNSYSGNKLEIKELQINLASDTDSTYQPYAKTNQQLTQDKAEQVEVDDIVNVYGSKNVLIHDLNSVYKLWKKEYSNSGSWSGRAWTFVGVTYTFNEDGSVTLTGTSTGTPINMKLAYLDGLSDGETYVLSNKGSTAQEQLKLEIDGTEVASLTGNSTYEFVYDSTKTYRLLLKCVVTGTTHNSTVYPMLCLKSIYELDSTYQPPAKTNQQLTEDTTALLDNLEVNGAVNMLPFDLASIKANNTSGTWANNVYTVNGVALTVNDDGSVTASGTATANVVLKLDRLTLADYIGKKFVDANKNSASSATYSLLITNRNSGGSYVSETYVPADGYILKAVTNVVLVDMCVFISNGQTVSDLTFKPMITVASYNGDYAPYAKSNRELTDALDAHTIGTRVDISSYTSTNYHPTSDGYLFLYNDTGKDGQIIIGDSLNVSIGGVEGRFALYVRKGTIVRVAGTPTLATFAPLS